MSESQDDIAHTGTEVANWSIKAFSVEMRDQINRAARQADCTVAEWLHGHFLRFGIAGQKFDPVKLDPPAPPLLNAKFFQDSDSQSSAAVETAVLIRSIRELVAIKGVPRKLRDSAADALVMQLHALEAASRPVEFGPFREIAGPGV